MNLDSNSTFLPSFSQGGASVIFAIGIINSYGVNIVLKTSISLLIKRFILLRLPVLI